MDASHDQSAKDSRRPRSARSEASVVTPEPASAEPEALEIEAELVDELAADPALEGDLEADLDPVLALDADADLDADFAGGIDPDDADDPAEDEVDDDGIGVRRTAPLRSSGSPSRTARAVPAPLDADRSAGLAHASALSAYMSQLRHHAPISREEEHELAVRWVEEGDVDAAKALVVANLRLVVKIAMEYRRAWTNTLDLVQEGNVGLMEAVQRFDPYQGVKLSSYAVYWIRAYILKYILDNMRSVRLGTTRASRKLFFRLNKEKRELERLGYEIEPRLLAERLDVTEQDVTDMEARLSRPDVSFDAPLRADEADGATFGDRMAAPGMSSESSVGASELRAVFLQKIEAFSQTLDERDLQILRERILAEEPLTLAELGDRFQVTRERVRQLEAKLVKRLRRYMEENLVDFEYYGPGAG